MGRTRRKSSARAIKRPPPALSLRSRVFARAREGVRGLLPVVAIVVFARVTLAEAYWIPSGSMEPTLQVNDWLFVNKLRFGPHIPFTRLSLPGYAAPKRNDVLVFGSPVQVPAIRITPDDSMPVLVKRVVGMPGDTLLMRHGELRVNGQPATTRNHDFVLSDSVADEPQQLFEWQHRIELAESRFGPPVHAPSLHEWGPLVVPAGTLFMMGDNRDDSVDSRYYGPVPLRNVLGSPMFVYYSYDPNLGVDYFRAITEIRWRRLGTWIR